MLTLATTGGELLSSFTEVESGKRSDRPQLKLAIEACRKQKAKLLIAKLDRLARNAAFLLTLRDSGVSFVAADMPQADKLTVGIMALFAEHERDMISKRTKEALAMAKLRGVRLGNPKPEEASRLGARANEAKASAFAGNLLPLVSELRSKGMTLRQIAAELTARAIPTARGGAWEATTVRNMLRRV